MKHVLGYIGALALGVLLLTIAAPAKGQAVIHRIVHFVDPVPPVAGDETAAPGPSEGPAALGPAAALAPWRQKEREGERAYGAGDFAAAAECFAAAAPAAPPADSMRLRARSTRANIYRLMAADAVIAAAVKAAPAAGVDPLEHEKEYRRRLDSLKPPTAGGCLVLADFAASRGLRSHLPYLYERADALQSVTPSDDIQQKVTRIIRQKREDRETLPKEVLEAVIQELPASEAADMAREESGDPGAHGASGVGGVSRRGEAPGPRAEDQGKVGEAYRLMKAGESEYRLAIPGSRDVNKHRRAALDAYEKARSLFEAVDKAAGFEGHQHEILDCNRNIAELHKDLPIGK